MPLDGKLREEAMQRTPLHWDSVTFWQEADGSLEVYGSPQSGLWWRIDSPTGDVERTPDSRWRIRAFEYGSSEPRADLTAPIAAGGLGEAAASVAILISENRDPRALRPWETRGVRRRMTALMERAPKWVRDIKN